MMHPSSPSPWVTLSANLTANSSLTQCPDFRSTHHLHTVVYSVVLALGFPLNALALWVFLRALRVHSVVTVYMCNLAASDLLFTLSLPFRLSYYVRHHWPFPAFMCQAAGAIFQMNMYGSCIFLTLINVDRYVAIVHPLRLRHLRRPRVARLLCLAVWVLILVAAAPTVLAHRPSKCLTRNGSIVHLCFEHFSDMLWRSQLLPLLLLAELLGFVLPLAAVLYSSGRVFCTLARPHATRSQRRRKTVRLLLANLVIFLLCFVPYNATLAVYGLLRSDLLVLDTDIRTRVREVLMVTVLLAGSNCVLDPLVYYFSAEGFQQTLRQLSIPLRARAWAVKSPRASEMVVATAGTQASGVSQGLLESLTNPKLAFGQSPKDSTL